MKWKADCFSFDLTRICHGYLNSSYLNSEPYKFIFKIYISNEQTNYFINMSDFTRGLSFTLDANPRHSLSFKKEHIMNSLLAFSVSNKMCKFSTICHFKTSIDDILTHYLSKLPTSH